MNHRQTTDYIQGEFRVIRALVEENTDDADDRIAAIKRRFVEAGIARDAHWISSCSGPDYKVS